MAEKVITLSKKGHEDLLNELEFLKTVKRYEIGDKLKAARAQGDLSENSEYDEAKDEQAKNETRIAELENMLKNVKIIDESQIKTDRVGMGSKVKIYDEMYDEEIEYTIKGSAEASPLNGIISNESPIGKALMGAKNGDEVLVTNAEGHVRKIKILSISK